MTRYVLITVDEALAAARAASWAERVATCGHTGCTDHEGDGPRKLHCMSGFGMDMPLDSVEDEIRSALNVGWDTQQLMRHHLVVRTSDGRTHWYDVPLPEAVAALADIARLEAQLATAKAAAEGSQ